MKRILNNPFFYDLYQDLIGCKSFLKKYATEQVAPNTNDKILDFGCGTATICSFLPKDISYVGVDYSEKYINIAKKNYPKYSFVRASVYEDFSLNETFDIIFGEAIIAALSDEQCMKMFENVVKHSHRNTRIIFSDMNYRDDDNFIQKFLYSSERNSYVRKREDYINLLSKYFDIQKESVMKNVYRIPYSKIVFECSLKN